MERKTLPHLQGPTKSREQKNKKASSVSSRQEYAHCLSLYSVAESRAVLRHSRLAAALAKARLSLDSQVDPDAVANSISTPRDKKSSTRSSLMQSHGPKIVQATPQHKRCSRSLPLACRLTSFEKWLDERQSSASFGIHPSRQRGALREVSTASFAGRIVNCRQPAMSVKRVARAVTHAAHIEAANRNIRGPSKQPSKFHLRVSEHERFRAAAAHSQKTPKQDRSRTSAQHGGERWWCRQMESKERRRE